MNLAHFLFFLLLTACFMKFGGCIVRMFTTVTQIGVDPGLLIGCVCVFVCLCVCVCVCVCVYYHYADWCRPGSPDRVCVCVYVFVRVCVCFIWALSIWRSGLRV